MLIPKEEEQSPPELTDHHGKAQCMGSAPITLVGWNVTEALRKNDQN